MTGVANVASQLLQQYVKLTEFLGHTLGPDYEVALHDLTDRNRSIVAIANSHVSGRKLGAPLTNTALKILRDKSYESQDYLLHYRGVSADGRILRSSTFFIKQNGKLIGMLCINFDDSRYHAVSGDSAPVPSG
ncbi:MAG: PAS domain-containing protein [Butyricicoccus sp.]